MRRIFLAILLFVLPGYSQTTTTTPSNLTLDSLTVKGSMSAPSIKLGAGTYTLILPSTPPPAGAVLGIKSVSGTTAQAEWVTGFSGTRKAGACLLTIQNGHIKAVTGC